MRTVTQVQYYSDEAALRGENLESLIRDESIPVEKLLPLSCKRLESMVRIFESVCQDKNL